MDAEGDLTLVHSSESHVLKVQSMLLAWQRERGDVDLALADWVVERNDVKVVHANLHRLAHLVREVALEIVRLVPDRVERLEFNLAAPHWAAEDPDDAVRVREAVSVGRL